MFMIDKDLFLFFYYLNYKQVQESVLSLQQYRNLESSQRLLLMENEHIDNSPGFQ